MPLYLADTSIWAWAQKAERPDIRERLADRYEAGEIVTCVPVILRRCQRRPAIDFLIAAVAEAAGPEIVLWCFDRDLKVICEPTGQPSEPEESTVSINRRLLAPIGARAELASRDMQADLGAKSIVGWKSPNA